MGDGGVACVVTATSSSSSQHIADRFHHGAVAALLPEMMSMVDLDEKKKKNRIKGELGKMNVVAKEEEEDIENGELEKGEFVPPPPPPPPPPRGSGRRGRHGGDEELEKGEFLPPPERWRRWDSSPKNRWEGGGHRKHRSSSNEKQKNSHSRDRNPESWFKKHGMVEDLEMEAEYTTNGRRKQHRTSTSATPCKSRRRVSEWVEDEEEDGESKSSRQKHEKAGSNKSLSSGGGACLLNSSSSSSLLGVSPAPRNSGDGAGRGGAGSTASRRNDSSGSHRRGWSPPPPGERSHRHHHHRRGHRERSPRSRLPRHHQKEGHLERSSSRERSRNRERTPPPPPPPPPTKTAMTSERSSRWTHDAKERTMATSRERSPHVHVSNHRHERSPSQKRSMGEGSERRKRGDDEVDGRRKLSNGIRNHASQNSAKQPLNEDDSSYGLEKRSDGRNSVKKVDPPKQINDLELPPPPPPPPLPAPLPESPLPLHPPPPPLSLPTPQPPPPSENVIPEEGPSMEEDMDICDTPPHAEDIDDSEMGKWYYLDHFGIERGPSKLVDLKRLVEDGVLLSDHLIKHLDGDRWVTVENAASPLVHMNVPSIVVSDSVTRMVSPPEPSGNVLCEAEDITQGSPASSLHVKSNSYLPGSWNDSQFDDRIGALLEGFDVVPGKELETLGEALGSNFVHIEWRSWGQSEGFNRSKFHSSHLSRHLSNEEVSGAPDLGPKELTDVRHVTGFERENTSLAGDFVDFACNWSCKGGDWKRNEDAFNDRGQRRKRILNEGYPLCQMPKCGYEDPRWHRKDDLYHVSCNKRLELPSWACSWTDDKTDSANDLNKSTSGNKTCQAKQNFPRVMKGIMLPVIRINACVVKDHGNSAAESRIRMKSIDRLSSRTLRPHGGGYDRISEVIPRSRNHNEHDLQSNHNLKAGFKVPKDHICSRDELSLHLGDWCYLDGASHEIGPFSFPELQELVAKGVIMEGTSVFRKMDNLWVPVTMVLSASETDNSQEEKCIDSSKATSVVALPKRQVDVDSLDAFSSFHSSHPQFMGFMCGRLHELVMKSYKSREFASAINGVLDPWLNAKQPKDPDKHMPSNYFLARSSAFANDMSVGKFSRSDDFRFGKRARVMIDDDEEGDNAENQLQEQICNQPFEDLLVENAFKDASCKRYDEENWGFLNPCVLARIFHFLRGDVRSIIFSAATCKHWNSVMNIYKGMSRHVDFSPAGYSCTDSIFQGLLSGFYSKSLSSLNLARCMNISPGALTEVLKLFPGISVIDIRGCSQFKELMPNFKNVRWMKSLPSQLSQSYEDGGSRARSFKQIAYKSFNSSKPFKGSGNFLDILDDGGNFGDKESNLDRKNSKGFRPGFYRRTKIIDPRKSLGAQTRNAQLKQLIRRKSENDYRKLEPLIKESLRTTMKENTFHFLVPKVAKIEERMKNGYYVRNGLISIKDDIMHMCRNVLKAKKLFRVKDMNRIISPFLQLVQQLEKPKQYYDRDESDARKKQHRILNEKRSTGKIVNATSGNDVVDYGTNILHREIKRSLSKLNKDRMNSESETSDEALSDGYVSGEGETTDTDRESDLELHSEELGEIYEKDVYSMLDEATCVTDDRDWGARMTKASLVPPATRKYEVIDHYLVVADGEEVRRKMTVALPEDYEERLNAQRNGIDEPDMEIPVVKAFKPRKLLGDEVIEQEVYGIDPYTHNLLLDTMPKELEWKHGDKHQFIEEALLHTLNRQVRQFTGSGNAPMVYQLHPVIEEVRKIAEEDGDIQTMKLCQALLKAMRSRPDDNYVAYRKGLGVVCNKQMGFGEGDFVVEFLGEVYPSWRWYEKQDGIRSLQENSKDPLPEFYNINLERPKGDGDGYDLVVVDAMHKANYASRVCHSCRPNCEAKVTAVNGHYQIGMYTVRSIAYGEEITFDYNSVTESKEEYEASVCLCGSQVCRGSFLNLTGEDAFQNILKDAHGILDRHKLMIEACEVNAVSEEDYIELGKAGLGSCLLAGLPDWLIAYSAHLVRFINFERTKLPDEILKHNYEEKVKYIRGYNIEDDRMDAEVQAEGVYNQRLQNMAVTIDKVKYVMRSVFGDPMMAPPPLERLGPEEVVSVVWKGEGSVIDELLKCLSMYLDSVTLNDLKTKIRAKNPSDAADLQLELQKSLLWLRDELRDLPCSQKCRNDAAADLIHIYAYTRYFFRFRGYKSFTSPPVRISPLDMGPKYAEKMRSGFHEYCKTYGEHYCLGQLIHWQNQTNPDPDQVLAKSRRGCLILPDISSFYANNQNPSRRHIYGAKKLNLMMLRMEKQPQRPWPKEQIWVFKDSPKFLGSPMLDAMLSNCPLDRDMMHWLKNRPAMFQGARDG